MHARSQRNAFIELLVLNPFAIIGPTLVALAAAALFLARALTSGPILGLVLLAMALLVTGYKVCQRADESADMIVRDSLRRRELPLVTGRIAAKLGMISFPLAFLAPTAGFELFKTLGMQDRFLRVLRDLADLAL